jgi:LysR family transcriptional activator of nhaA
MKPLPVERLNFHHLHYFWSVAHEGNLTRAAAGLRVSQSALSSQIRQLEASLGEALFERVGRGLVLTEAGRVALSFADDIFATGEALRATLAQGRARAQVLRVGAVATLSRNFQESFLKPLFGQADLRLSLHAGGLDDLLARLSAHSLDLVLSNRTPRRGGDRALRCRRLARQAVSIVGPKRRRRFTFPDDLRGQSLIVPGKESEVRGEFDALCEQLGVPVHIVAEVDDMAMLRLLARDTAALALVPSVVVRDELKSRALHELCVVPGLFESFYAVTVQRHYPHPLLRALLGRDEEALLSMPR